MNETIVVGVTDARSSRRAVDWAIGRAADRHDRHDRILLVSVVGGAVGVVGEGAVLDEAVRRADVLLAERAGQARAAGVPVATRIARGDPTRELIDATRESALLVLGSDYRGPDSRPARGPHGIRTVAGAHCTVVVIPDLDLFGRSGIVVGVDGSAVSEAAIAFAAAEADRTNESLTAISAWTTMPLPFEMKTYPREYLQKMQSLTEESLAISLAGLPTDYPDLEVRRVVERGYPAHVINRRAASARLTVVGTHGQGPLARFLLGSVSQHVLARLAAPTAVVR